MDKNFTTTFLVNNTPEEVFNAINNVRGWWSENIDGSTDKPGAEFLYHYKDVHISKMKIVEFIPNKKVVWLVLQNQFNFTKDQSEWKGNTIVFDISEKGNQTQIQFTHVGLTPAYECYNDCHDAWTSYIQGSLKDLITTGKGKPNTKEDDSLNTELIEKWGLPKK
ncbi:MAG: SRPBCC domain-containing protein [Ginsengibacter sp.]